MGKPAAAGQVFREKGARLHNPWVDLPNDAPYVLPRDEPYVNAWNLGPGQNKRLRLHTRLPPEPFVGPRDGRVVVLQWNPGYDGDAARNAHRLTPDYLRAVRGNLGEDRTLHVHFGFLGGFGDWWRRRWRTVREESDLAWEDLARRVFAVEWLGYASRAAGVLPVTLPSQLYSLDLVRRAVARGAVVVLTYGRANWRVAVPELRDYPRAFATKNPQSTYVTRGNLLDGFDVVLEALCRE